MRRLLALMLLALAGPVHAEVITLVCQNEQQKDVSFSLRIDFDRRLIAEVRTNGSVGEFVPARITEGEVSWDHVFPKVEVFKGKWGRFSFSGALNRMTGQGWVRYWRMDTGQSPWQLSGRCARAERKF